MVQKNPNSILLLYEGDTEEEFYKRIVDNTVPKRRIRISYDNLKGITTNINRKILHKIYKHLQNNINEHRIFVFVAIDREGDKSCESPLDINEIINTISVDTNRIQEVFEIIATQDIESWFFIDIDGIYKYLKVPKNKRNPRKYSNYESYNNRDLSNLFRRYKRIYSKGHSDTGLLGSLDLKKIYNNCPELQEGIEKMISLIQK